MKIFLENISRVMRVKSNFFHGSSGSRLKIVTGQRVMIFMGFHGSGRVGSGQKLSKYPRVTGNTGNLVYLVRVGSRVGSHGSGNDPQHP